jgi:hypothetical protein
MSKHTLHLFRVEEIAEELALRDAELLRRIGPAEICNGAWMDKERKEERAPNVLAMVQAFNSLAQLVAREILAEENASKRAEVIATYIKVSVTHIIIYRNIMGLYMERTPQILHVRVIIMWFCL